MGPWLFIRPARLQPGDTILWGDSTHEIITIHPGASPGWFELEVSGHEASSVGIPIRIDVAGSHRVRVLNLV